MIDNSKFDKGSVGDIKLSIIVTVFNEEKYIEQCINSIFDQKTSLPYEIVCIDDGSTDHSPHILNELQQKSHVPFIISRINNSGSSATPRNTGLMISSGEWVYFVDGDDWINKFTIKRSIEEMGARAAADMILVGCEFAEVTSGKRKPLQDHLFWTRLIDQYLGQTLCPSENLDLFRLDATICRKLFRKSFLDSIGFSFADNSLFEDVSANYQLLLSNPRISLCDYTAYNYRIGHSSRITKCSDRRLLDVQKRLRDCIDMLVLDDSKLELWSVFFQYQGWIHQWLLKQIEFQYKKEYAAQCVELFRSMPWEVQAHLENSVIQELAPSQLRDLLMAQSKGDIGMLLRIGTMPKYQ